MKVFPLTVGHITVPYGQFYGGLTGWEGLRALYHFATDKHSYLRVPMHAYLILHPEKGPLLVDVGICSEQVGPDGRYYKGLSRLVFDENDYRQKPTETIQQQLRQLGFEYSDIKTIVLTHLHEDHVGGLKYFPNAKVFVSKAEWESRRTRLFGLLPMYYEKSFTFTNDWHHFSYDSGPFYTFERSKDLLGDKSVLILPTPGHTAGHSSVLINMGSYQLMITSDCLYTLRHLATQQVQAIRFSARAGAEQVRSIRRIAGLKRALSQLYLLVGHDHTNYQWKYILPFLAKGWLTDDEREALSAYERGTFDEQGNLRIGALPEYLRDPNGGVIGRVAEPLLPSFSSN